jgi:ribonuclease HI
MSKNLIKSKDILEIYVDGVCRKNPGPASIAFFFVNNDEIIHQKSEFIGNGTNNIAEYTAIIRALEEAEKFTRWRVKVYSDSQIAIKQINKKWRIKAPHLSDLCSQVYKLSEKFEQVEFFQVGRENLYIQKCDELFNECLDKKGIKR